MVILVFFKSRRLIIYKLNLTTINYKPKYYLNIKQNSFSFVNDKWKEKNTVINFKILLFNNEKNNVFQMF